MRVPIELCRLICEYMTKNKIIDDFQNNKPSKNITTGLNGICIGHQATPYFPTTGSNGVCIGALTTDNMQMEHNSCTTGAEYPNIANLQEQKIFINQLD